MARRRRGQAAVETALVMPLALFLMLGVLQLGLAQQARQMTKYAAYRAVRAGVIRNADTRKMTSAALAVLVPLIADGGGLLRRTTTSLQYVTAFGVATATNGVPPRSVEVTVCGPLSTDVPGYLDWDDPRQAMPSEDRGWNGGMNQQWRDFNRTRLSIQVTFNFRLIIPFANGILYMITRGMEHANTLRLLRMNSTLRAPRLDALSAAAAAGRYYLPIRAGWSMRMQSSFLDLGPSYRLPGTNACVVNRS